jgi:hypothetical protein
VRISTSDPGAALAMGVARAGDGCGHYTTAAIG